MLQKKNTSKEYIQYLAENLLGSSNILPRPSYDSAGWNLAVYDLDQVPNKVSYDVVIS